MSTQAEKDELIIIYDIIKNERGLLKLFDYYFIQNNIKNCYIKINKKICELTEMIDVSLIKENQFIIKLKNFKNITDASNMFFNTTVSLLPNLDIWDFSKVTNMNFMFGECIYLKSLPDTISNLNTSNITDMSRLFFNCKNLISLPDISDWDTSKVENMSQMFFCCYNLKSLPDISGWETSNVKDISGMFDGCSSLITFPDLSNWDVSKVTNMESLFQTCSKVKSLPNILKWN